eukprot:gene8794-10421_t
MFLRSQGILRLVLQALHVLLLWNLFDTSLAYNAKPSSEAAADLGDMVSKLPETGKSPLRERESERTPRLVDRKTAIVYSYFEPELNAPGSNTDAVNAKLNLQFFIEAGVLGPAAPSPEESTFFFIIHGHKLTVEIPEHLPHVHVIKRDNQGGEYCGWYELLNKIHLQKERSEFSYFFYANGSVRGPFLPPSHPKATSWVQLFTDKLDDTIKMAGTSVNCYCVENCVVDKTLSRLHLQSFAFATDRVGLDLILPRIKCGRRTPNKDFLIQHIELGMSAAILEAGYNLASTMHIWDQHNFQNVSASAAKCQVIEAAQPSHMRSNVQRFRGYFGMTPHPFEFMFLKSNQEDMIQDFTSLLQVPLSSHASQRFLRGSPNGPSASRAATLKSAPALSSLGTTPAGGIKRVHSFAATPSRSPRQRPSTQLRTQGAVANRLSWRSLAIEAGTDKSGSREFEPCKTFGEHCHDYSSMYTEFLESRRRDPIKFLEIGLGCDMTYGPGKSLNLWTRYFENPSVSITFLESDAACVKKIGSTLVRNNKTVRIYSGDQSNRALLRQMVKERGPFDFVVDDGGHQFKQQRTSMEFFLSEGGLRPRGMLFVEDMHVNFLDYSSKGVAPSALSWTAVQNLLGSKLHPSGTHRSDDPTVNKIFDSVSWAGCQEQACFFRMK